MQAIRRIDRRSPGKPAPATRRLGLAVALAATAIASLIAAGPRPAGRVTHPAPAPPAHGTRQTSRTSPSTPSPVATAVAFARAYVALLYSRGHLAALPAATASLRARLEQGSALATPAELDAPLSVQDLAISAGGLRTATASALIIDPSAPPTPLTFRLRLAAGRWMVVAASVGARQ